MTMFENDNPIMPRSDDGGGGNLPPSVSLDLESIDQKSFPEGSPDTSSDNQFCLATCILAIARYYNPEDNITMTQLQRDKIVESNGYSYPDRVHYFNPGSVLPYIESNISPIKAAIANGYPIIFTGKSSLSRHYVVAYGYSGNTFKIMDPWNGKKGNIGTTIFKDPPEKYRICRPN